MKFSTSYMRYVFIITIAFLVPFGLHAANITNVIGTYDGDTFETPLSPGDSIIGQGGWYADTNEITAVVSNGNYLALEAGSYGLTNRFVHADQGLTNVVIQMDVMMNPADDVPEIASNTENQVAIWLGTNGQLYVRHDNFNMGTFQYEPTNSVLNNAPITNGQWITLTITMDYKSSIYSESLFTIQTNGGTAFTNRGAFANQTNTISGPQVGARKWFRCQGHAPGGPGINNFMSDLVLSGAGYFDNIYVTNFVTGGGGGPGPYTITVIQTSGGSISPGSPADVADGNDSEWFTIAPNPNWYVYELVVNTVAQDPSTGFQFTAVTSNEVLSATFASNNVIATSNDVPQSWMQERGIFTNDYAKAAGEDPDGDGISTADEYLGSTDPFDADSFLEVHEVGRKNGTNFVKWLSIDPDNNLPPFGLQYKTDLTKPTWTNASGNVVRSGSGIITNIWWENDPIPAAFYRILATNAP